jgi:hypothetical protein
MVSPFKIKDPYITHFKQKSKPITTLWDPVSQKEVPNKLPKFSLTGSWSPSGDIWRNTGISFDAIKQSDLPNERKHPTKNNVKMSDAFIKKATKGGIQTSTGWITKDTLHKGARTILGMSEQMDYWGNVTRGENYANPNFTAWEDGAAGREQAKKDAAAKKSRAILGQSTLEDEQQDQDEEKAAEIAEGQLQARLKQASKNKVKAAQASMTTSPDILLANQIQADLGRSPVTLNIIRRRRGRWRTELSADPVGIINDFYKKSSINEWAAEVDPEHAKIDPNRMVTVTDTVTPRRVARVWCHNNNCRTTGYDTVYDRTYKEILATEQNKGAQMDQIYDKVLKKAKGKRKKYETYYKTDTKDEDYEFYGVTDKDFASYDSYKKELVTDIGYRRENQEFIIGDLKLDTKTISKEDRNKHLIPTLVKTWGTLDTTASTLKKQVSDYDWKKRIRQDTYGKDTIQGHSMIGTVLDSYDGELRGGDYYAQDVGKLVKRTKSYETAIKSELEKKKTAIQNMKVDETGDLGQYYFDKSNKEYAIADEEYTSKSLAKTVEDRKMFEKQKKQLDYNKLQGGHNVSLHMGGGSRSARPSLKEASRRNTGGSGKTRTRGGQNTLGGLVI